MSLAIEYTDLCIIVQPDSAMVFSIYYGKVTADVLIGGVNVGTWLRGGFEEVIRREHETRYLPRFWPLFMLEINTYSFLSIMGC